MVSNQLVSSQTLGTHALGQQTLRTQTLPQIQEWWTPADIADYLHLTPNAVTYHCRRLFPQHAAGHRYRLNYEQAQRVYNYVRKFGCKRGVTGENKESAREVIQEG